MKHFSLGLLFGATAGLVLSLVKDQNGERLGQPLKKGYDEGVDEAKDLKGSINKAKDASQRLAENMPAAKEAISGIADDVENYQSHSKRIVDEMNYRAKKIQDKMPKEEKDSTKN